MKFAIARTTIVAGLLAFAVAPLVISAAPLTSSQTATLKAGTKMYFKSLASGDASALTGMSTPDFAITRNGKKISTGKLSGMIQAAKLNLGSFTGSMSIDSASAAGGVVTEMVTLNGQAETMRADSSQNVAGSTRHKLTWVKAASGKWLLSHDEILSASHS